VNKAEATRHAHAIAAALIRQYLDDGFYNTYDETKDAARVEAALERLFCHLDQRSVAADDPVLEMRAGNRSRRSRCV
jgi:hypothetical protein